MSNQAKTEAVVSYIVRGYNLLPIYAWIPKSCVQNGSLDDWFIYKAMIETPYGVIRFDTGSVGQCITKKEFKSYKAGGYYRSIPFELVLDNWGKKELLSNRTVEAALVRTLLHKEPMIKQPQEAFFPGGPL